MRYAMCCDVHAMNNEYENVIGKWEIQQGNEIQRKRKHGNEKFLLLSISWMCFIIFHSSSIFQPVRISIMAPLGEEYFHFLVHNRTYLWLMWSMIHENWVFFSLLLVLLRLASLFFIQIEFCRINLSVIFISDFENSSYMFQSIVHFTHSCKVANIIRWLSAHTKLRKSKKNDDDTTFNGMLNNWNVASGHGLQCMHHIRFTWLNSTKCSATTNVIIHRLHGNTVIRIHEYTKRNENCIYLKHMVNGEWWLHLHLQWFWFCFSETSACYCKRLTFASNVYL